MLFNLIHLTEFNNYTECPTLQKKTLKKISKDLSKNLINQKNSLLTISLLRIDKGKIFLNNQQITAKLKT